MKTMRALMGVALAGLFATACATTEETNSARTTPDVAANAVQSDSRVAPTASADAEAVEDATVKQTVQVYNKSTPRKSKMHCTSYMPTGSHRKKTRCVTLEQKQQEEDAARNTLMNSNRSSLSAPAEGGGP